MSKESGRIAQILSVLRRFPLEEGGSVGGPLGIAAGVEALDDCAVINCGDYDLVVGADFVRGARFHLFQLGVISWEDIGWYVVAANVSDISAMGARPVGITLIFRYTPTMRDVDFEHVMQGVASACQAFSIPLLGGDTGSFDEVVLSATALGVVERGTALLRSGGRPGDFLYVSDEVGRAGAAIAYFRRGVDEGIRLGEEVEEKLANSWRKIEPPQKQAIALRESGACRAAIDTSDGLKAAIRQLVEASGVDAIIEVDQIPVDPIARMVAEAMKVDAIALAVGDSVDFRLVFSVSESSRGVVAKIFRENGWPLFRIGRLVDVSKDHPRVWLSRNGKRDELPGVEWAQGEKLSIDELRLRSKES